MKFNKLILLVLVLFVASFVSAQDVISATELAKTYKGNDVVVICATSEKNYKVHITGSVNVPHSSMYKGKAAEAYINSPAEMAKVLAAKGVTTDKTIVVYDEGSAKYAGRMYWMLKYLGAPNVKMLNGNMKAWKAKRKPITSAATKVSAGTFTAKVDASVLAKADEVKKAVGNSAYVLVDARKPDEFAGTAESKTLTRKGHIPGAVNVNHETVMDSKGLLKSNDDLKALFEGKGITKDKTIVVYCETSVRAGVVYLALKGLGYPKVKVYDGAYLEWQSSATNKVE